MYKEEIIKLKKLGLTHKQIREKLGCALSTITHHLKNVDVKYSNEELSDELKKGIREYYKTHTKKETAKKFGVSEATVVKYSDCKRIKFTSEEKVLKNRERVRNRRKKVKEILVLYKGGKCIKCGYDKYIGALEFHHINPEEKDFSISNKGETRSIEVMKTEVDKCELVCSNCHKEIHAGIV